MWGVRWRDGALCALVLAAQSAPFLLSRPIPGEEPWTVFGYLPVVGASLPVLVRRRVPLAALLLTELCVGAYQIVDRGPAQPIWYSALVCMYAVGLHARRRSQLAAAVVTAVGIVAGVGSVTTAVRELLMWSAAFALGALTRARRELAERAAGQAAELAAEQERTRIARDLHDILGHAFSLMVVQAEAGGAVVRRDATRAETAFDTIAETGRTAMSQLRGTVATLREPSRAPQPGLADLPDLVSRTEQAGLVVTVTEDGERRPMLPDAELAAYRVVQEALTNVVKHASANQVWVRLGWHDGGLRLTVTDDGRGAATSAGGHGLVGMRERVTAAGGTLSYGPRAAERGFRVEAVFG